MKNLLLFFSVLLNRHFFSQSTINEPKSRRFYQIGYNVNANDLVKTKDGGNIVVGNLSYTGDNTLAFAVKSDSTGTVQWSKPFSCFNSIFDFSAITELPDSSVIMVGRMFNQLENKYGAACQKLDKNGNVIWAKAINSSDDAITHASNIIVSADSNLLITGYINGFSSFLVKLDTAGNIIFGKTYTSAVNTAENLFKLNSITELADSSIVLVGTANWGTSTPTGVVIKTDANGNILWSKNSTVVANLLDITNDHDFVYINDNGSLVKLSISGNIVWKKNISSVNNVIGDQRFRIKRDLDSNIILTYADLSFSVANKLSRNGDELFSLRSMGQIIDIELYNSLGLYFLNSGPCYGVKNTLLDRHFAISKIDSLNENNSCNWQYSSIPINEVYSHANFALTIDSNLQIANAMMELFNGNFTIDSTCVEFVGGIDELSNNDLLIFPNPATDLISIQQTNNQANESLIIFDQQGRIVKVVNRSTSNEMTVDISELKSGVYFIQIGNSRSKFVKE